MYEEVSFSQVRRLVRLAVWAAFMALGAWVSLPIGPVPITLQTFFIFLAAFAEGPAAYQAVLLYLGAGLLGLPVFAGGLAGPALVFGPTAGYALSFPLMAAICGLGRPDGTGQKRQVLAKALVFGFLGLALVYLCGAVGLCLNAGYAFPAALAINLAFIPGDSAKVVCAALVAFGLARSRAKATGRGPAEQIV